MKFYFIHCNGVYRWDKNEETCLILTAVNFEKLLIGSTNHVRDYTTMQQFLLYRWRMLLQPSAPRKHAIREPWMTLRLRNSSSLSLHTSSLMVVGRPSSLATLVRSKPFASRLPVSLVPSVLPRLPGLGARAMSATAARPDPFRPAKRVAGQRQDVW